MKDERISKRVRIPVETIPHLIGKHPKHERFLVLSSEQLQMQQQHTSDWSIVLWSYLDGDVWASLAAFSDAGFSIRASPSLASIPSAAAGGSITGSSDIVCFKLVYNQYYN
jgi:hypothetical protein